MLLTHVDLIEKLYVSSRLPAVCLPDIRQPKLQHGGARGSRPLSDLLVVGNHWPVVFTAYPVVRGASPGSVPHSLADHLRVSVISPINAVVSLLTPDTHVHQ